MRSLRDSLTVHRTLCPVGHLITSMVLWLYTFYDIEYSTLRSGLSRTANDRPPFAFLLRYINTFGVSTIIAVQLSQYRLDYQMANEVPTYVATLPTCTQFNSLLSLQSKTRSHSVTSHNSPLFILVSPTHKTRVRSSRLSNLNR